MELLVPPDYVTKPQDLKKMYVSDLNARYVQSQIQYAVNTLSAKKMEIPMDFVRGMLLEEQVFKPTTAVIELHKLNKPLIINTAKLILEEPRTLEFTGAGIDEHSFREGVWHPEDLFMRTPQNRNEGWKPFEVRFDPRKSKWNVYGNGIITNPNEIYQRHYDFIENNGEDRRTQIPRKINYF